MSAWTFYLQDRAPRASTFSFVGMSSGRNCVAGYDNMFAAFTSTTAEIHINLPSALSVRGFALANHNLANAIAKLYKSSTGPTGPWTQVGTDQTIPSTADFVFDAGSSNTARYWSLNFSSVTTANRIACVSLLSGETNHLIVVADENKPIAIDSVFDAGVVPVATAIGEIVEQIMGGSTERITLTLDHVRLSDSSGMGLFDEGFMLTTFGIQGWRGPFWMVDDNGKAYHVRLIRPVQAPYTRATKGRRRMTIILETVPHYEIP
jgi:hypothetical protein